MASSRRSRLARRYHLDGIAECAVDNDAHLPARVIPGLHDRGWHFYVFVGDTGCRFMCAWDTTIEAVDRFVGDMNELAARAA